MVEWGMGLSDAPSNWVKFLSSRLSDETVDEIVNLATGAQITAGRPEGGTTWFVYRSEVRGQGDICHLWRGTEEECFAKLGEIAERLGAWEL